ncbi:hypothetical protein [Halobaculum rubrum]|uniref:hypothetical protein n=1 Tax=Halobaculum rubrum TaxID=2872158 RepID=UPI001CA3D86B|nr:hypothetical protein [Halobaculum rubrum]QZX99798.1 hypothetical protein K6T25_01425 [Halobaculum rubrum]QZX99835.1 hypothetical protein K6T25_01620 [Halobaculum rubrum]
MKRGLALLAAVLVAAAGLIGATGGAVAADVELTNETVAVDGDTRSVYADLNATSDVNTSANFTVEFVGIDADGNETGTLDTRNVTVDSGNTSLVEYTDVNASAYSQVKVMVHVDNTTASTANVSAEVGTIQMVAGSGGGGGIGSSLGSIGTGGLVAIVLVGGYVLLGREGDE